jgi:hypothetical protein
MACNQPEVCSSEGSNDEDRLTNEEDNIEHNILPVGDEDNEGSKYFGDFLGTVQDGHIRLAFANINGIPPTSDHPKNSLLQESINTIEWLLNR